MHRYQTYNFRFQLLRQKTVWAYNIAAVCCKSHVQENMLISNRFTSIQGKTISRLSEFRVSFQNFRVSLWHPKTAVLCTKGILLLCSTKYEKTTWASHHKNHYTHNTLIKWKSDFVLMQLCIWSHFSFSIPSKENWHFAIKIQICLLPYKRIKMINLALPTAVNNHSVSIGCRNSLRISGKYFQQFV